MRRINRHFAWTFSLSDSSFRTVVFKGKSSVCAETRSTDARFIPLLLPPAPIFRRVNLLSFPPTFLPPTPFHDVVITFRRFLSFITYFTFPTEELFRLTAFFLPFLKPNHFLAVNEKSQESISGRFLNRLFRP